MRFNRYLWPIAGGVALFGLLAWALHAGSGLKAADPKPETLEQMFRNLLSDTGVGTDPAFSELIAANWGRDTLLAPSGLREFLAARKDLFYLGIVDLQARFEDGRAVLVWIDHLDFYGESATGAAKAREQLTNAGFKEARQLSSPYLQEHRDDTARRVRPDSPLVFSKQSGETTEEVVLSPPCPFESGSSGAGPRYNQEITWGVVRNWAGDPPTF
jgi:hypothetical protein